MHRKKTNPSFTIHITGKGIEPARVSVRAMTEVLSAVQSLMSGRDTAEEPEQDEEAKEAESNALSLVAVKSGSVTYQCSVEREPAAIDNIVRVKEFFTDPASSEDDRFAFVLSPTKTLSAIAKALDCTIAIKRFAKTSAALKKIEPFLVIDEFSYKNITKTLLVSGDSTLSGTVMRVGGATGMRCVLRIQGRDRLLYCDVDNANVIRELGDHLYEEVTVSGKATWLHKSWTIYAFKVFGMIARKKSTLTQSLNALWNAGGKEWAKIDDPSEVIRGMRN